jgi:hypothetical protein
MNRNALTMKSIYFVSRSAFAALLLILASGCGTTMAPVAVHQAALPETVVFPHRVALVLTPEFTDFKHEFHLIGGTDKYPIGDALKGYAMNIVGKCFQAVDTVNSEENATSMTADDLVLIPRVVKSDSSFGKRKFNLTLVLEWTAKTRANGAIVWVKTFTANSMEPMGSAFTTFGHRRALFQKAFDDLTPQTCKGFQEAHEFK